jgi:leucyl-tRNA synthetase
LTGIVTSVPFDLSDGFDALTDLNTKQTFREKYNLIDQIVLPFDPVSLTF